MKTDSVPLSCLFCNKSAMPLIAVLDPTVLCKLSHLPAVVYYIRACKHCGTEGLLHMAVEADRGLLRDRTDFSVIRYIKDTAGRSIHRASAKCIPSIQGA
jgi:hypothetical protein